MKWKLLASEYLFRDTWFTVRKDTCEGKNGKIITPYYVYEFPTWVCAIAFTKEGKVILERQYRHAIGETAYELPGGCMDPEDATTEEAIARELLEETGYRFDSYEYLGKTCCNPSTNNNWMHFYIARGGVKVQEQDLDENEELEVQLHTLEELVQLVNGGSIIQSMHVTACYYAFQRLGVMALK